MPRHATYATSMSRVMTRTSARTITSFTFFQNKTFQNHDYYTSKYEDEDECEHEYECKYDGDVIEDRHDVDRQHDREGLAKSSLSRRRAEVSKRKWVVREAWAEKWKGGIEGGIFFFRQGTAYDMYGSEVAVHSVHQLLADGVVGVREGAAYQERRAVRIKRRGRSCSRSSAKSSKDSVSWRREQRKLRHL